MTTLLRLETGYYSRRLLAGAGYAVESENGGQQFLHIARLTESLLGHLIPTQFRSCVLSDPRDGWRSPPMAGGLEESSETARGVGFGGGLGGSIGREE